MKTEQPTKSAYPQYHALGLVKQTEPYEFDTAYTITRLVGLFMFILLITLFNPIYVVPTGYVGVLLDFDKPVSTLDTGIHFIIPIINSVQLMSLQIQKTDSNESAASSDLQTVRTEVVINYKIGSNRQDIMMLYINFLNNHEDRIIRPLIKESVKATTAQYSAEELITKRSIVKQKIYDNLARSLSNYSIELMEVSITDFDFSPEFNKAIESKMVAEQNKLQSSYELQQKQIDVQKTVAEANASATSTIMKANADAYSELVRANATAQAIYMINQQLTGNYLTYTNIKQWDGVLPKVTGSSSLLLNMNDLNNANVYR